VERIYKFSVGSVWPPMFGKFYIESVQSFGNNFFFLVMGQSIRPNPTKKKKKGLNFGCTHK
jgi:hypothetical protein